MFSTISITQNLSKSFPLNFFFIFSQLRPSVVDGYTTVVQYFKKLKTTIQWKQTSNADLLCLLSYARCTSTQKICNCLRTLLIVICADFSLISGREKKVTNGKSRKNLCPYRNFSSLTLIVAYLKFNSGK